MTSSLDQDKQDLLQQVIDSLTQKHSGTEAKQASYYAKAFFRRVPMEELTREEPAALAAIVSEQMAFIRKRTPGEALISVFNPTLEEDGWESKHTIIEMVNDDMPFLVDSASVAMAELNISIHLMIHPVIHVERDEQGQVKGYFSSSEKRGEPESIIHMQIDRHNDPELLASIKARLEASMHDVRLAVNDWQAMMEKAQESVEQLPNWASVADPDLIRECQDFISWMKNDHFVFLGCRDYKVVRKEGQSSLHLVEGSGLGLLRETQKSVKSRPLATLSDEARTNRDNPLIITKTKSRCRVHRAGYMDYVGVLRFDKNGQTIGERRFIGLFTSNAYFSRVTETPLVRLKVAEVLKLSGLRVNSHAEKSLVHILETLPRDELLQATVQELADISTAVLNLQERKAVRLLIRRERFARFYSCLVYIPRDRFNTENRLKIQKILKRALKGETLDYVVQIADSVLARLQVIVRPKAGEDPQPDIRALEHKIIEAVRTWTDELTSILIDKHGEDLGMQLAASIGDAFPAAYLEDVSPWVASFDVEKVMALENENDLRMSLYRPRKKETDMIRFKLFRFGKPLPLSGVLPMLENMGLHIISERPYELNLGGGRTVWIQDFDMVMSSRQELNLDLVREPFQEAFEFIMRGVTANDSFNRLILACHLHWRQVKMLRAYCKYLLQTGTPFSMEYMARTLSRHHLLAYMLAEFFDASFNPERVDISEFQVEQAQKRIRRECDQLMGDGEGRDKVLCEYIEDIADSRGKSRDTQVKAIRTAFLRGLGSVSSLDEDRILHSFYRVIQCTLRTNFYQLDDEGNIHDYMSFKLDSANVPDLPKPRPFREIWIYSTRVEGIHLRMGKVARGGLRWSDRQEDFRTEVLGLMKAQNVKNTMIVPVGAKGGFVVQNLPEGGSREAIMAEVTYCYKIYINALLDITDNLDEDKVLPPKQVIRRDEDDPYLVVAADKGTATFSDTANAIAIERGFWLGDAFASGGSVGYDHKGMGITAKGAWEGVKRHFRELGTNIQKQPFTVVGIGDMSGDVFGNGMLLSRQIRLRAAFNHAHIFLDPGPDEAISFKERKRLFALPRSSWTDYNPELISRGGGVFSRRDKTIPVSMEVRAWLGIKQTEMAPYELIRELLKADVDLLWNGGIGTYVKSSKESNVDVGDLANNSLRIDGDELNCKVVGEGGNLGFTQLGRVEFAQNGGRVNTDFIDNSAGVDCSDHEVNIKILLNQALRLGRLDMPARSKLLASMTNEVSELVLRSNYLQTQALSMMEKLSGPRLGAKQHFISVLEHEGQLDRQLEGLPDDDELLDRRNRGQGLTRPELSILLSYSKIRLYSQLLDSDIPEDPFFATELERYFPTALREQFVDLMPSHRLKRELIATQVTNSLVNRMGVSFVLRMRDDTSATAAEVARAYAIARELFDARAFWDKVEALDNKVDAALQTSALLVMWSLLRQATRWLANHPGHDLDIQHFVDKLKPGMDEMLKSASHNLSPEERILVQQNEAPYLAGGFTKSFAHQIATLPLLTPALDVVAAAAARNMPVKQVADVFYGLGDSLGFKWFRGHVEALSVQGQWHAHARGNLRDELYSHHRQLVDRVLDSANGAVDPVAAWINRHQEDVRRVTDMMQDMRNLAHMDYATLSVAVRSLGQLLSATEK